MLLVEQYTLSVISFATDGVRFPEQVIMGKKSITPVFISQFWRQDPDNSTSDKFLKATLSRFILILKASWEGNRVNQERR